MYPQTNQLLTEDVVFAPNGPKGQVRAHMANMVLQAMQEERVEALIARAPEFYGPDKTQGFTNFMVLNACRKGKQARVFMRADTLRTLIFTPDASRATALLGNTADAFGQTWHLPCDDNRMTYAQLIAAAESLLGHPCDYRVLRHWQLILLSLYKPALRETKELWPRYAVDNLFDSSKFKSHFPEFSVTSYIDGLRSVLLKVHIN
jgi:nucleoside-diphosphate-sugar epimerase